MYCFLSGGFKHGGGAQTIQVLLIEQLTLRGIKCKLFDVENGSVVNELIKKGIQFEFVRLDKPNSKKDYSSYLTVDDLLIVFDTNLWGNLYSLGNSSCKILVWEIYYPWIKRSINYRYIPSKYLINHLELKILNEIVSKNGFYFIDYMGKELLEKRLNHTLSDGFYLPIPVVIPKEIKQYKLLDKKITISYVGRSVEWKMNPFIKILFDIQNLENKFEFDFIVICDNIKVFSSFIKRKFKGFDDSKIQYFENLSMIELNRTLLKSDLHFAMGTSALDGAKLGIPTILIDASFNVFPDDYKYRWVFETKKLNLGKILSVNSIEFDGTHTFSDIIKSTICDYELISISCKKYVIDNYSIENVVTKIIKYNNNASLTFKEIRKFNVVKYMWLLRKIGIR
jgi:hypothetical protein